MKRLLSIICLSLGFSTSLSAEYLDYLTKDQIVITDSGIFCLVEGYAFPAYNLTYTSNGTYAAEYYGQCGRCGWALNADGNCTNQNCRMNGPRERD